MGKTLVIAEKPSVGRDIAKILHCYEEKDGYMEGNEYVVTWAVGHLVTLKFPEEHDEKYKKWEIDELPFSFPIKDSLKVIPSASRQFSVVKKLIHRKDIDMLINAGDAGREGYLIQSWIYRMAGNRKPVKVLWASSATAEAIQKSMANLKDDREFYGILEEAEGRAEGDWRFGINYSRALSILFGTKGVNLSYGRCQTPLLNLICKRDREIKDFKARHYYNVESTYGKGFKGVLVDENKVRIEFFNRVDAEKFQQKSDKTGVVKEYKTESKAERAPLLYSLPELQKRMGSLYGYEAGKTLEIAQTLYESRKILSYPRTDSRYLSSDLKGELKQHILSCNFGAFQPMIEKADLDNINPVYFNDLKVADHYALIPTINEKTEHIYGELTEDEKRLFDEIVKSVIAICYPKYEYDSTSILIEISDQLYLSKGTTIKKLGFKEVLKSQEEHKDNKEDKLQILPLVTEGDTVSVDSLTVIDKVTKPPKKYTTSSILTAMEKYHIGTPATMSSHIEKLQERRFIDLDKGKYSVTELGKQFIGLIPEKLKSADLTEKFEERLQKVNAGEITKDEFLHEVDDEIRNTIKELRLFASNSETSFSINRESLGKCPQCGADVVSGKFGAYCSGKCGMRISSYYKIKFSDKQVKELLSGKRVLVRGLVSKTGKKYDAYYKLKGTKQTEYEGKTSYQYEFDIEFPERRKKKY